MVHAQKTSALVRVAAMLSAALSTAESIVSLGESLVSLDAAVEGEAVVIDV